MINSCYLFCFCAILMISSNNANVVFELDQVGMMHFPSNTSILRNYEYNHPFFTCIRKYGMTADWLTVNEKPIPEDICMKDIECRLGDKDAHTTKIIVGEKPKEGSQCSSSGADDSIRGCVNGKCVPFTMAYKFVGLHNRRMVRKDGYYNGDGTPVRT